MDEAEKFAVMFCKSWIMGKNFMVDEYTGKLLKTVVYTKDKADCTSEKFKDSFEKELAKKIHVYKNKKEFFYVDVDIDDIQQFLDV